MVGVPRCRFRGHVRKQCMRGLCACILEQEAMIRGWEDSYRSTMSATNGKTVPVTTTAARKTEDRVILCCLGLGLFSTAAQFSICTTGVMVVFLFYGYVQVSCLDINLRQEFARDGRYFTTLGADISPGRVQSVRLLPDAHPVQPVQRLRVRRAQDAASERPHVSRCLPRVACVSVIHGALSFPWPFSERLCERTSYCRC